MWSERMVSAGSLKINLASGPENGPPLLWLHGVIRNWRDGAPLWPVLMPRWHVHALDHRGHGKSDRGADHYHVREYIADAVAVVRDHLPEGVVLVGHSLGALVAAGVASALPDRVRAVVLEEPPSPSFVRNVRSSPYHSMWQGLQNLIRSGPKQVGPLTKSVSDLRTMGPNGQAVRLGDVRDAAANRFLARCLLDVDPAVLTPLLAERILEGHDLAAVWKGVRCPTLVIRGDGRLGGMLSRAEGEQMIAGMADAHLVDVPEVGHLIHWDDPARMGSLVLGFLESL